MDATVVEHEATLWLVNDIPARMFYAGRRWLVTDTPTRLKENVWTLPLEGHRRMFGWRFQATDEQGETFVFDVYRDETDWHVHHVYS